MPFSPDAPQNLDSIDEALARNEALDASLQSLGRLQEDIDQTVKVFPMSTYKTALWLLEDKKEDAAKATLERMLDGVNPEDLTGEDEEYYYKCKRIAPAIGRLKADDIVRMMQEGQVLGKNSPEREERPPRKAIPVVEQPEIVPVIYAPKAIVVGREEPVVPAPVAKEPPVPQYVPEPPVVEESPKVVIAPEPEQTEPLSIGDTAQEFVRSSVVMHQLGNELIEPINTALEDPQDWDRLLQLLGQQGTETQVLNILNTRSDFYTYYSELAPAKDILDTIWTDVLNALIKKAKSEVGSSKTVLPHQDSRSIMTFPKQFHAVPSSFEGLKTLVRK